MRVKYSGKCLDVELEATVDTPLDVRPPPVLWVLCMRESHHEDQQVYEVLLHRQDQPEAVPEPAGEEAE